MIWDLLVAVSHCPLHAIYKTSHCSYVAEKSAQVSYGGKTAEEQRQQEGYKYFPLVQVRGEGSQEVETVTRHQMGPYAPAFLGSIGTPPNITQNHPNF